MAEIQQRFLRQLGSPVSTGIRRAALPVSTDAPEDDSLLRQIGRTAVSGAQIIGNTLNKPSRALWGTANALFGGESGGGLLNLIPFSDTLGLTDPDKGIELSRFLENRGVLPKDEEGFQWSDVGRIGVDILGDPLSWMTPFALTKAGTAAAKTGGLAKGFGNQIRAGQRAVVGFNPPLMTRSLGEVGTGQGAARVGDALDTGIDRALYANIPGTGFSPGQMASSMFDPRTLGLTGESIQRAARAEAPVYRRAKQELDSFVMPITSQIYRAGTTSADDAMRQRSLAEGVLDAASAASPREYDLMKDIPGVGREFLERGRTAGVKVPGALDDDLSAFGLDPLNYVPRSGTFGANTVAPSSPLSAKNPSSIRRNQALKGFRFGSAGVNVLTTDDVVRQAVQAANPTGQALKGKALKNAADQVAQVIRERHGDNIIPTYVRKAKGGGEVEVDRFQDLAKFFIKEPQILGKPLFNTNPLVDLRNAGMTSIRQQRNANIATRVFATEASNAVDGVRVSKLSKQLGLEPERIADRIIESRGLGKKPNGQPLSPNAMNRLRAEILRQTIPTNIAQEMLRPSRGGQATGATGAISKAARAFNSLFKAGVLTSPSRYVRDLTSGMLRNAREGAVGATTGKAAADVVFGKSPEALLQLPQIQDWLQTTNRPQTAENAADAAREMFASFGPSQTIYRENIGDATESLNDLVNRLPGISGESLPQKLRRAGATFIGRDGEVPFRERMNPLNVKGVGDRTETTFGPAASGEIIGNTTDELNRMTPFLERLRQGYDPAEARRLTDRAQVDYSNDNFTPFEQGLSNIFPFYRFSKAQIPYLAQELASRPGGRLGQAIGATGDLQSDDPFTPDYLGQSTAIPLGMNADGSRSYVTGLGLMHEDPLSFLGGGVRGALAEGISRTSPLIKAPIEWASGESFFQRGPEGGRELGDMDPTIGRTLNNIGRAVGLTDSTEAVRFPGSEGIEFLAGNSPASRLLTTARQLTDQREGSTPFKKFLNTMTGTRLTTVSPAARDAIVRELTQAFAKDLGASDFRMVRFTKQQIADLEKTDPVQAQVAKEINQIMAGLSKRAKDRKNATQSVRRADLPGIGTGR